MDSPKISLSTALVVQFLVFGSLFLYIQHRTKPDPIFKVGDCIQYEFKTREVWEDKYGSLLRIEILGSKSYKTSAYVDSKYMDNPFSVYYAEQDSYVKVNCP